LSQPQKCITVECVFLFRTLVTIFIFNVQRQGESLPWGDVERSFDVMTSQTFQASLPRPVYSGEDCLHNDWAVVRHNVSSSVT